MNFFIINDGMVVIAAPDLNRCRELFAEQFESACLLMEYDAAISSGNYKVLEVMTQREGIVSHVFGGR